MDQYSALWLSYSSIKDFLACPRAYYFRNVYKDPITRRKIARIEPPLALGQVVHDVLESLAKIDTKERQTEITKLLDKFRNSWVQVSGKKGGFKSDTQEKEYMARGESIIKRVMENPKPLLSEISPLSSPDNLPPRFDLSKEDNIILCGKVDWIEYLPESDSVHIIDFKTSKNEEAADSLQLPIYLLLAQNCQAKPPTKASYWYLNRDSAPQSLPLPDTTLAREKILEIAKRIKLARQIQHFKCPQGNGCRYCIPYEQIIKGKGEKVNERDWQDVFVI